MFFFKNKKPDERRIKAYQELLKRKDKEISELQKKNELLLKTALRQAQTANEWKEYAQKLEKEKERLEEALNKRCSKKTVHKS